MALNKLDVYKFHSFIVTIVVFLSKGSIGLQVYL